MRFETGKTRSRRALLAAGLLAMTCAFSGLASSDAQAQTIEAIKAKGKLVVGVQADQIPWGFIDEKGQNAGLDPDVARLIGKELGVEVEFVRVTVPNRIATLLTAKVDVLLAVMGMYPDRAKVVQFTRPYSVSDIVVLGKKGDSIKEIADLKAFRVGVSRASAQDIAISKQAPQGTSIQRFDDDSAVVQALVANQVDAIGGQISYMANINKIAGEGKYERKILINRQYNGFSVRPGQKEFTDWLNAFIERNLANGQLNAINKKWLDGDLPEFPTELAGIPFTVQ